MADLTFPQLNGGALVQYPIRKTNTVRTIRNILADGTMLVNADPGGGQLVWTLSYVDLPLSDMEALQAHFNACGGALRAFTFVDPTDNLLQYSAALTGPAWTVPAGIVIQAGLLDPLGGASAFTVTNTSAAPLQIVQNAPVPVSYHYCFSVFSSSASGGNLDLIRSSANVQQADALSLSSQWSRLVSSGQLSDTGTGLSVAISLAAGQTISLFGPQLEPQLAPSRFRATYSNSGVYPNAHWAVPELIFTADAPGLFSTSFSIETSIWN